MLEKLLNAANTNGLCVESFKSSFDKKLDNFGNKIATNPSTEIHLSKYNTQQQYQDKTVKVNNICASYKYTNYASSAKLTITIPSIIDLDVLNQLINAAFK